jgi:DNA primase/energy-coupling factor transporter ATP-binding protein EcfA2
MALKFCEDKWGFDTRIIEKYKIGFLDYHDYNELESALGIDILKQFGFVGNTENNKTWNVFQNRIIFPYFDKSRKPTYFIGRATNDTPKMKYVKQLTQTAKNPQVLDIIENRLYYISGNGKTLYVTEGISDAISLHENTKHPIISPVTTRINKNDIPKIAEYSKKFTEIIFVNDNEDNNEGIRGAIDTINEIQQTGIKNCKLLILPRSEGISKIDANDYFKSNTVKDFNELKPIELWQYKISHMETGEIISDMTSIIDNVLLNHTVNETISLLALELKPHRITKTDIKGFMKERLVVIKKEFPEAKDAKKHEIKSIIKDLLYQSGQNISELQDTVFDLLYPHMQSQGRFITDGNYGYYISNHDNKLIIVSEKNKQLRHLLEEYDMLPSRDKVYSYLTQKLEIRTLKEAEKAEIFDFSHYDIDTNTLYIDNKDGRLIRITVDGFEIISNGTDGMLFHPIDDSEPYFNSDTINVPENNFPKAFEEYVLDPLNLKPSLLDEKQMKYLSFYYFLAMFFDTLMPTKIIMACIGDKGSGKTTFFKKLMLLLHGRLHGIVPANDKTASNINTIVTNNNFVVIDNADDRELNNSWVNNFLSTAATGAEIQVRKLYSDNELLRMPFKAFVGLTGMDARSFSREDVADRMLIMSFKRINSSNRRSMSDIQRDFMKHREMIFVSILYELRKVLMGIENSNNQKLDCPIRMMDFGDFCLRSVYGNSIMSEEISNALVNLSLEQRKLSRENDWLYYMLCSYINRKSGLIKDDFTESKTAEEIYNEMKNIDGNGSGYMPKGLSVKRFQQRMSISLKDFSDTIEVITGKNSRGINHYSFKLKEGWQNE